MTNCSFYITGTEESDANSANQSDKTRGVTSRESQNDMFDLCNVCESKRDSRKVSA